PEEIVYVERPVLVFDDPIYAFEPPPPPPVFFCHHHQSFFSHHRRRHSASSCCRSRFIPPCRYGYARPFTLRRHLQITLFSRTFTTQSSLTTSIRSRSPSQVAGQEP